MRRATGFQRSVALASLAQRDLPIFVEQFVLECPPTRDFEALRTAWTSILDRHTGLMAQYDFSGAQLRYRQLPPWDGRQSFETATVLDGAAAGGIYDGQYRPFSIGSDEPLWRVAVVAFDGTTRFCLTVHHLIFDEHSLRIVRSDLAEALRPAHDASPRPTSFEEFLAWRASHLGIGGPERDQALATWDELASGLEGPTVLPILEAGEAECDANGRPKNRRFPVPLNPSFPDRLRSLLDDLQLTVNHVAMAAWALVLSRLCRTDVVCFGQVRHGIPAKLPGADSVVGSMVDTWPFVVPIDDQTSLVDFLADVSARHRKMYALQSLEVSELLARSFPAGAEDVMSTVVNNVIAEDPSTAGRTLTIAQQRKSAALQPTMTVIVGEQPRVEIVTSARHAQFGRIAAEALGEVLTQFVERRPTLGDISATGARRDRDPELCGPSRRFGVDSLPHLLETSLQANAQRTALDGKERLTYAELDRASLAVARSSGMLGHTDQLCVAVVATPGLHAVIPVVAALRSGHYFICIDPARPPAEVQTLLHLIGPDLVICGPGVATSATDGPWETRSIDMSAPQPTDCADTERSLQPRHTAGNDLAYLVATSGSTGVPKVVEIEQASAVNAVCSLIETYGMTPEDRRLRSVSRPGADVFIAELLVPLCSGATLVEAIGDRPLAPAQFFELLDRERITIAGAASSYLAELVESRPDRGVVPAPVTLRMMTTGTEVVDPNMVASWHRAFGSAITLLNVYGPAEATLVTTTCLLSELAVPIVGPVPIGLPLPNTRVRLLDRAGHPVPRGAVGEICVAGPGVMRGYRGIESPTLIAAEPTRSLERYYRTGDLGRIGPDGQLVFHGRSDRQVKIRGHRVELDGVEARLRSVTAGSTVAVVAVERLGRLVLLAAVECSQPLDEVGVRASMAALGSPAEVPAAVVAFDRLPRLANGKLDRRAIARQLAERSSNAALPAGDPHTDGTGIGRRALDEHAMVSLWNELFEVDDCHPESDFFDLGGDSLLAVRLAAELDARFGVPLDLDLLYTVRRLDAMTQAANEWDGSSKREVVRPLAVNGRDTRVVFMHTAWGVTRGWLPIASLLADTFDSWAITGSVARGLPAPATVADACAEYVEALSERLGSEPLVLVGFSATGVLAYETARLARAAGMPVRRVVLLETPPTHHAPLLRRMASASMVRRRGSTTAAVLRALRALRGAASGRRRPAGKPTPRRDQPTFIALVDGHRPGPADFDVSVIETRDPHQRYDLRLFWSFVARRWVDHGVIDVGVHTDVIDELAAPLVAAALRRSIEPSQSRHGQLRSRAGQR